jgi:phage replication O-like protein O
VSEKLKPNFTPIPNVILDEIMRKLSPGATKVLFTICRFTYGYGRQSDRISLSQLAEWAGLNRRSVSRSIKQLGPFVTIAPGSVNLASEYRLNIEILDTDLEAICHQGQNAARGAGSDRSVPFQRNQRKERSFVSSPIVENVTRRLNELAGAAYRPNAKSTVNLIRARLAEGFSESDLMAVVEDR